MSDSYFKPCHIIVIIPPNWFRWLTVMVSNCNSMELVPPPHGGNSSPANCDLVELVPLTNCYAMEPVLPNSQNNSYHGALVDLLAI